jgi:hypothetical protein
MPNGLFIAKLHPSLSNESSEEVPHLVVGHAVILCAQFLHDLDDRPFPIAQAQDRRACLIQDQYSLRRQ